MTLNEAFLIDLHLGASTHRGELEAAGQGSCFHCLATFPTSEVSEWLDENTSARCPRCGVDAVLPGVVAADLLHAMQLYWFGAGA